MFQINLTIEDNKSSIFCYLPEHRHFELLPGISFHFYTSHTPCGDASIFPKENETMDFGNCIPTASHTPPNFLSSYPSNLEVCKIREENRKRSHTKSDQHVKNETGRNSGLEITPPKRQKHDIHRTGAKCVPSETKQDPKLPGFAYHVLGAVRTKPGRGDPTLSVSCSDKLMRWNAVGIQVKLYL